MLSYHTANERGLLPQMALQGYLVGSPGVNFRGAINDRLEYAHNLGLISFEYLKQAETACNGEYVDVDISNLECQSALQVIYKCLEGIDLFQILEPACPETNLNVLTDEIALPSSSLKPLCRFHLQDMYHTISQDWANNPSVRNALGIREGTKGECVRCNYSAALDSYVDTTVEYHLLLATKGYHGLVYNGDHDMLEPYITNLKWIYSLNLTLDDNWRPWKANGKVAGFTMRYREDESYLTFATIKGSGHFAPEYSPQECFAMASRWLSREPL